MVIMTVLTPVSIIGREPCPLLHPCPSLSIPAIAERLGAVAPPDAGVLAPALGVALSKVTDPRKARGIRHRFVVLLTVTVDPPVIVLLTLSRDQLDRGSDMRGVSAALSAALIRRPGHAGGGQRR